jgi:hypothetical protein
MTIQSARVNSDKNSPRKPHPDKNIRIIKIRANYVLEIYILNSIGCLLFLYQIKI